jgi:hypothetical protein
LPSVLGFGCLCVSLSLYDECGCGPWHEESKSL